MLLSFAMCASACARETYRVGGESSADGTKGTDVVLCGTSADTEPSGSDGVDSAPPEKTPYPIPISNDMLDLDVKAPQCYVYSVNTGTMLYLKGRGEILYPASTTKLLTIMYALTLLSPDELVTPGDELSLVGEFSTIAYVRPNHTLTVEMLIEGMLLPSGNDAAYVLAAAAGRKLTDDKTVNGVEAVGFFVEGMNSYAKTLGMTGSHFTSPDGYYNDEHYTTVEDMAIVGSLAVKNPIITKYAAMPEDHVVYASGHTNDWKNTNLLITPDSPYYSPYVTGLKTVSFGEGNYSLVVSADIDGRSYVIGFFSELDQSSRFEDALYVIDMLKEL